MIYCNSNCPYLVNMSDGKFISALCQKYGKTLSSPYHDYFFLSCQECINAQSTNNTEQDYDDLLKKVGEKMLDITAKYVGTNAVAELYKNFDKKE